MSGMNRQTGKIILSDKEHTLQSIDDIITTPKGSRVMNRKYGSDLFELIDDPVNKKIDVYAAVAQSLDEFEPRFELESIKLSNDTDGRLFITVEGMYLPSQERLERRVGL